MSSNKALVIMPTYCESKSLPVTIDELVAVIPNINILIVDDASPDGTGEIADDLAKQNANIRVLHRAGKEGLGPAYLAGFAWGLSKGFDVLVEMDADGSHRAADLPLLLEKAGEYDLVIGSRWIPGGKVVNWPAHRKLISLAGNFYTSVMLGLKVKDATAGYRAYRADFLNSLNLANVASHGYSFQVEMTNRSHRAKARIVEVPITFVERTQGASKMTAAIVLEALWLVTKWGITRLFVRS